MSQIEPDFPPAEVWVGDLDQYFDRLEQTVNQLDVELEDFIVVTAAGNFKELEPVTGRVQRTLSDLESLLEQRSNLLMRLVQDGQRPRSIRAFLRYKGDSIRLDRARSLALRIEQQRRRTITIFTAHYWMYDTTREVLRMITNPGPNPGTYGVKVRSQGGGLLDEAA